MANRDVELAQCIFFDACDALELKSHIDDNDEVDCPQCGDVHSSRQMFIEQIENIKDQAQELEKRWTNDGKDMM